MPFTCNSIEKYQPTETAIASLLQLWWSKKAA